IDLRHEGDHFFLQRARSRYAFDRGGGDTGAQWFCEYEKIAGTRICVCGDASDVYKPCNRKSVDRFWIANGMAADDHTSDFGRLGKTAAQNRRNYSWPNEISRETDNVECSQRTSPHGENVGQRVGGCDLAVGKRKLSGGEDRNRTYLATYVATTVLKTARATRHPSLSGLPIADCGLPIEFFARNARFGLLRSATARIRRGELDAAFDS